MTSESKGEKKESYDELTLRLYEQEAFHKVCLLRMVIEAKSGKLSGTEGILKNYLKLNPDFENARNYKLLKNLIEAFNSSDVETFQHLVFKHDAVLKLDAWQSKMLLTVRNAIKKS
jgi:hypothetical protein